mmetsp:Transcript_28278/g.40495  ORF Transcript_28278/g.40495 Transcript_28278/m.40495 type:complete len:264 (-) Transcript_28278:743-1534(-)
MSVLSSSDRVELFKSSLTRLITLITSLGPRAIPTIIASVKPNVDSGSFSIGRLFSKYFRTLLNRIRSSSCKRSRDSETLRSASPRGFVMGESIGRKILPLFRFCPSMDRLLSAVTIDNTAFSISPKGPGTSMGRTISPPRRRDTSIRCRSACSISSKALTSFASASPRGPRLASCKSIGRNFPSEARYVSDSAMIARNLTAFLSSSAKGPSFTPSSAFPTSIGRTTSPPFSIIRFARLASSSITFVNHPTAFFSAVPNGPMLF